LSLLLLTKLKITKEEIGFFHSLKNWSKFVSVLIGNNNACMYLLELSARQRKNFSHFSSHFCINTVTSASEIEKGVWGAVNL